MSDAPAQRGAHLVEGMAAARQGFLTWVDEAGSDGRTFLQAHVSAPAPGIYRLRHVADAALPASSLTPYEDPFAAREIAQTTTDGQHRPLKTAPSLRRGWTFEELDGRALWTALDYLYPACAAHWYAGRKGTLRVTHWRETSGRQSGMYSAVGLLSEQAVRNTVRACCGDAVCLRRVAWGSGPESPDPFVTDLEAAFGVEDAGREEAEVPCPEACSIFVSLARNVLTVERGPEQEVPGLGVLKKGEIEQLGELVAASASGRLYEIREGEFENAANLRRLRYLAAKLGPARAPRPSH